MQAWIDVCIYVWYLPDVSMCCIYLQALVHSDYSIRIPRPWRNKMGEGGKREAVSCFRGRKPPLCHNNDFVLWSPVTYGFEHKQRWVKNYTMLLFCHCPVYVSYTDCITERWPFIHVSFVYFFILYFLCMFNPEIRKFFFGHWRLKIHFSRVCLFFFMSIYANGMVYSWEIYSFLCLLIYWTLSFHIIRYMLTWTLGKKKKRGGGRWEELLYQFWRLEIL